MTAANPDVVVSFKLKAKGTTPPVKGSLTMKVVDSVTSAEIMDANPVYEVKKGASVITDFQNMELGVYEVTLKSFDESKYEVVGDQSEVVTLTEDNPNETVTFKLKAKGTPPVKGSLTMKVVDSTTSVEITDANATYEVKKGGVIITDFQNMELGDYEVTLKSYDGTKYEAVGNLTKTVSLTSAAPCL